MVTFKEATEILQKAAHKSGTENVLLSLSLFRVLAEDIFAVSDFPSFNKSAVDGYACRRDDLEDALTSIGTVFAGEISDLKINKGQCVKIFSGAMLPEGADCIIMLEHTAENNDKKILVTSQSKIDNIFYLGEDKKKGELILSKGTLIQKRHIGILAANGIYNVNVYNQPLLTVFASGKELVEPEDIPGHAQIRNSNGPQLMAQLQAIGINAINGSIIDEDEVILEIEIAKSVEHFHGIIFSGGISGGENDFIPQTLKKMGFQILFDKVNTDFNENILFATRGDKFCIGLSGNSFTSYIQFEILVKPFLFAMMGYQYIPDIVYHELEEDISATDIEKINGIPVKCTDANTIARLSYHDKEGVFTLSDIYGLLNFPLGALTIKKGEFGQVRIL